MQICGSGTAEKRLSAGDRTAKAARGRVMLMMRREMRREMRVCEEEDGGGEGGKLRGRGG